MGIPKANRATLRIWREGGSGSAVTARLSLEPSFSFEVGERGPDGGRIARTGAWHLSSGLGKEVELDQHLRALLDQVEPQREALWELAGEGYKLDFFCGVWIAGQGGVGLDVDLLSRLGRLPILLDLDIYADWEASEQREAD